jgi:hypothetical protein
VELFHDAMHAWRGAATDDSTHASSAIAEPGCSTTARWLRRCYTPAGHRPGMIRDQFRDR